MIEDAANRRPLIRSDFDKVEIRRSSFLQSLGRGHYAKLFSPDADEPNGADADLFVDARPAVRRWQTIE